MSKLKMRKKVRMFADGAGRVGEVNIITKHCIDTLKEGHWVAMSDEKGVPYRFDTPEKRDAMIKILKEA